MENLIQVFVTEFFFVYLADKTKCETHEKGVYIERISTIVTYQKLNDLIVQL